MIKNKDIAVIIPSYNEVRNLSVLIKSIYAELPGVKIIIVDDSVPEENKKLRNSIKGQKAITLISRLKKSGRGSAVLDGFREAIKHKNTEYFFEMDSDLAHDPKEMKRFTDKNNRGNYDMIIGSRYLPGGEIKNIAPSRTIMSRLINKFLYYWLGIHLTDHTSGFRLYKRDIVKFLLREKLRAKGFIALSEWAYRIHLADFKIDEVPITWNYRIYGKSTVNGKELINSLAFVIKMRLADVFRKISWKKIFAVIAIFVLALSVRANTLNQMGRTWDEAEYIEQGYKMDELIKKGDFTNSFFYTTYDHPPLAKYIYGLTAYLDVRNLSENRTPIFNYDYTYSRLLSAVFASLSAVLILLIAWEFVSPFAGIASGIIFSLLPFFIGLSQLVSTESILMFLFTSSVYSFIKLLKSYSLKKLVLTGILVGLALEAKQSNVLLFPILGLIYLSWYINAGKLTERLFNKKFLSLIAIGIISIFVFIVLWPMPYWHLDVISKINQQTWLVKTAPPIIFWGRLIESPIIYFATLFFVTTPVLIIFLSLVGLKKIEKEKKWIWYSFIIWFAFPFIQSFYVWRVHGIRYIIEVYAPLSIMAGIGLAYLIEKLRGGFRLKAASIILILLYMFSAAYQIKPYYLDYFNELVGGTKSVYEKRYFELGWWGQGLREAGYYLRDNASKNSTIALFISPPHVFPPVKNLKLIFIDPNKGIYDPSYKYDYIIVNDYHVLREGFDDSRIKSDYKLIYQVKAGGAPIVNVYQSKAKQLRISEAEK